MEIVLAKKNLKMLDLSSIRREYLLKSLSTDKAVNDPLAQFSLWMQEAIHAQLPEPTAMILTTCGKNMQPTARVVLLKTRRIWWVYFFYQLQ